MDREASVRSGQADRCTQSRAQLNERTAAAAVVNSQRRRHRHRVNEIRCTIAAAIVSVRVDKIGPCATPS